MRYNYKNLANRYISNLVPYQPGKPIETLERELGISDSIKLASNENVLGPSPKAIAHVKNILFKSHFYPDGDSYELKKALSEFLKVNINQLTIGNGSENILEVIIKSYLGTQDNAVVSQYAFLTIPLLVKSYGAHLIEVQAKNFGHDIENIIKAVTAKTRIIFIVNPNNPTGTYIPEEKLILLLNSISPHIMVVIDEAYYDYIQNKDYPDTLKLLKSFPNLIITRTFSKIYGLAALRLGYSISNPDVADILNRARLPFNVNSIAMHAAIEAIKDREHLDRTLMMNNNGMKQLEEGLRKLNLNFIPSVGNFITIHLQQKALDIYQKLLQKGVIVRPLNAYTLTEHLRVTIGTYEQNERFLATLQSVIGES